ncbi:MAG: N-acetylglucosamine kinase, partial [Clostridium sp.]|uniref:N-acetylglucosamine kinase n=1 Tax=Clostridium sp. TaxID=1506 RepID=UPI003F3C45FC
MYYLGIDGGGTKTQFTITDEKLNVIGTLNKGTSHFKQIGLLGVRDVLKTGFLDILKKCNIKEEKLAGIGIGIAGYGNVKEHRDALEEIIYDVFKDFNVTLKNDVEIAHAGALGGEDGVVIVAGTGSIALSKKGENYKRCGGWGYTIGDEGSAYYIGKKIIEIFSKEADGRKDKTPIYDMLKKYTNIISDYDLIKYINEEIKCDRLKIAELSMICFEAAKEGDKEAINIFSSAASELSEMINLLVKDYDNRTVYVSYLGGVFKSGEYILKPLKKDLKDNVVIIKPKYTADIGAIIL